MGLVGTRLLPTAAVDLLDEAARLRTWQPVILELLLGELSRQALETGVVPQDPAIHELGIPKRMPGEPFHP